VDSGNTHGYFARIYRDGWVGSKSFADKKYGGRKQAVKAAWDWWELAEVRLPKIPEKPVLRTATVYEREEKRRAELWYFDVYTPPTENEDTWSTKFYFGPNSGRTREDAQAGANQLAEERNLFLRNTFRNDLADWEENRDLIMGKVLELWPEVKDLVQPPQAVETQPSTSSNR